MRLNKYLAHATGMSRRDADTAIAAGRVSINNRPVILGSQVNENDIVAIDHRPVNAATSHTYIVLNKPIGYLCSRRSQGGTPTIYELLPEKYRLLKAVGRLDKDSSGILLLTDDGDFAHRMTHPSFHKVKVYEVELDKPLAPLHQQMISDHGISLEDGVSQLMIERLDSGAPTSFSEDSALPAERGDTKSQLEPSGSEEKDGGREVVNDSKTRKLELIELLTYHLDLFDTYQDELGRPFETLKRFFKIYIRDFDVARDLRGAMMIATSTDEVRKLLQDHEL